MPTDNNRSLIIKLKKGDKAAFEVFYWSYRNSVYNLALTYLKDSELAEDAVQDVFLKLWENRKQLNDEKSLQGLLFRSLKNHVLNMMKINKRRITRQYEYLYRNSTSDNGPEEFIHHAELEIILQKGLKRLPPGKQTVYRLKVIDGFSNHEIAERLQISIHTVKSQYNRANSFLQKYVQTRIKE